MSMWACVCMYVVCALSKVIIRNARFHVGHFFYGAQQGRLTRCRLSGPATREPTKKIKKKQELSSFQTSMWSS